MAMKLCSVCGASAAFSCAVVVRPPLRRYSHMVQKSTRSSAEKAALLSSVKRSWPCAWTTR